MMKITRLKRGYVIRLYDTDFDLLSQIVKESLGGGSPSNSTIWPAQWKASITRRERGGDYWRIDEDRRCLAGKP